MSEFGKGFAYCIGLFLAHAERDPTYIDLWFNAAADHLYDLQIPEKMPNKQEIIDWQNECLKLRITSLPKNILEQKKIWAIEQAKKFLLEYDICNGVEACKANWE